MKRFKKFMIKFNHHIINTNYSEEKSISKDESFYSKLSPTSKVSCFNQTEETSLIERFRNVSNNEEKDHYMNLSKIRSVSQYQLDPVMSTPSLINRQNQLNDNITVEKGPNSQNKTRSVAIGSRTASEGDAQYKPTDKDEKFITSINLDTMDGAGAYGGGKAGAAFDPISFVQRPQVILRAVNWLFAVIIFGCISSEGWITDSESKKEVCILNNDSSACNYGVGVSVIAFLASMGFLAGEYFFEQMSSVKTRKHYVLGDLGFSAFWAFLYFVGFCYLSRQWSKAEPQPMNYGSSNMNASIVFSFFAIFTWGASAYLAYLRFKQGADAAFTAGFQDTVGAAPYDTNTFDQAYQEPPFSQRQMAEPNIYQEPTY